MEDEEGGSRIESGVAKRVPRWVTPFLRSLERTGEVRSAAEDAGIDYTTAYGRRRAHGDFALAWDEALDRFRQAKVDADEEELQSFDKLRTNGELPSPGSPPGTSPASGRGELVGAGSQLKRVGHGRWSQAKERLFFDELAATANVKRAAAAAGVSANAVYARRMKQPVFRAKWDAVLETGRAAIEMKLVEAANRSFDPDDIDTGDVEPKVSVAEAIRIVQVHGSRKQQEQLPDPFAEQAASMSEDDIEAVRERIIQKLKRIKQRDMPDMIAAGWSYDEAHDHMVPPGWVWDPLCYDAQREG
jgi:hypothetical protein